ncbi:LuxR C-terminal-related transcriptional regulator [Actinosynnema sp. NPDC059335]|uniref:helix-turn-helix transcriptional regulator n=1 Tax=Actinosynnema sp. NPDC059335 TaxID=3346804 RepID=UPI00367047B1
MGSVDPIKVLIGIRNELARYGLERLLATLPRVGRLDVRNSPEEALRELRGGAFDVVVVALGELDQPLATDDARSAARRLVIMGGLGPEDILRAADVGGHGFLSLPEINAVTLDETLRRMVGGEVPMPVKMANSLLAEVRGGARTGVVPFPASLTPREQQVLSLLVLGLTNKQIARKLRISSHGVKRLVANILAKLNTPNRTLAVAKALRDGWAPVPA